MPPAVISNPLGINIDSDFWTWYNSNKDVIPYYAPPPITVSKDNTD